MTTKPPVGVTDILAPKSVDEFLAEQAKPPEAITTPFPSLNRVCGGIGGRIGIGMGGHITIGGDTGGYKTLLVGNLAAHAALCGVNVGFCSLEMSREELQERVLANVCRKPVAKIERGSLDADTRIAIGDEVRSIEGLIGKFYVNEDGISKLDDIVRLMEHYHELECKMLVVDYMQLVAAPSVSLVDRITDVSRTVRDFARSHHVVTIGVSQITREAAKNRREPPTIESLYGGRSLETDSNMVLLLDHSRYDRPPGSPVARTYLIIAKNRRGDWPVHIPIEVDHETLTIREGLLDEEDLWP